MIRLNVKLDVQLAKTSLAGLEKEVKKAASRAINRTADSVKSAAVKDIAKLTRIKQKDVRGRIYVKGSSPQRLIAEVQAFPYSPNLKDFRATQNRKGVAASAWEKRKTYRHAFVMPSGRVVTRTTDKRFPLKGLRGPSVPNTFLQRQVIARLEAVAHQRWRSEFERELARRIRSRA